MTLSSGPAAVPALSDLRRSSIAKTYSPTLSNYRKQMASMLSALSLSSSAAGSSRWTSIEVYGLFNPVLICYTSEGR
jgi:hypothetical protein